MPPPRSPVVPLRHSLVVRLLVLSVLVAVGAIAATAWLTAQTTTQAIEKQQAQSLSAGSTVYDTLLGYAAEHPTWTGVPATVGQLARRTGRRIVLTTKDGHVIADSDPARPRPSGQASATVDPLRVSTQSPSTDDSIDARAVGPYELTRTEKARLDRLADDQKRLCVDKIREPQIQVEHRPNGRPQIRAQGNLLACPLPEAAQAPTRTEARALADLTRLTESCLGRSLQPYLKIDLTFQLDQEGGPLPARLAADRVLACVQTARREQLKPYVAPPALLFVTDPGSTTIQPSISLTRKNLLRIALGTAVVLAAAVAVTVAVGLRLARPLRRLAEAARRPIDQQHPITITTKDEIGSLASALNDLSERRDRLEEQRRAMVSDVAHELRTPLANIRSWLDAAQDQVVPAGPQLLALLSDETFLLQRIVDDLRDLAAADAGTLRLHCDFVYVNDVLTGVVEAHRGAAGAAGIQLSTDFRTDAQMSIDPVRLRQIVGNLVSNAIRHSDSGSRILVRTRMEPDALAIDVADEGTGIEPGVLKKVFDRFWRADSSRSRTTGGSGLGLAIARELTVAHDGKITVVSELGVGSTFTVHLPASRQAPSSGL